MLGDFPGGPLVKNLPSNAGDADSIPVRGTRIPQLSPRTTGQLGLCTTVLLGNWARAPQLLSPHALEPVSHN